MNKLIVFAALAAAAMAVPLNRLSTVTNEEEVLFGRFKVEFGKVYFDEKDETYRKDIFAQNLRKIQSHNSEASRGVHTYTMAMNEFGDLTAEEFKARYTGYKGPSRDYMRSKNLANLTHVKAADSVDWVAAGAVTGVKNQGQCGSCWSFSSTGAVEGAWFISKNKLVSLSEQELMDCSKAEGNQSCEGGLMDDAFEFVVKKGLCTESEYPYKAVDENSCKTCTVAATISGYTDVDQTEAALEAAVTQQPVAVAIEADQSAFQFYSSGVMTGKCGTNLDHGVLAVGYGELDGVKYWKVKNSWGETWGMKGYILLERAKAQQGGQCGILLASSFPTV